jgi:hypothetical protein
MSAIIRLTSYANKPWPVGSRNDGVKPPPLLCVDSYSMALAEPHWVVGIDVIVGRFRQQQHLVAIVPGDMRHGGFYPGLPRGQAGDRGPEGSCAHGSGPMATRNFPFRREPRLEGSPREGLVSARKPSFHCEREIDSPARSGSASGDALNQRALGGKLPLSFLFVAATNAFRLQTRDLLEKALGFVRAQRPRARPLHRSGDPFDRELRPAHSRRRERGPLWPKDARRKGARGRRASSIGAPTSPYSP